MKSLIFASLLTLAFATGCLADLADNQIDDELDDTISNFGRYVRPRARYAVKTCKPCADEGQCQVMGMQRFAEPRCEALGGLGAPCRPFQEADNKTLSFPNTILYCNNVYMQFCPCAHGLVCDPEEAECRRPQVAQRPTTTTTTTRRPQWQPQPRNTYQFAYAKPERYSEASYNVDIDDGFGETEAQEAVRPLVPMRPMRLEQPQESSSWTVRRQPQWPWAVAARFH